MILIIAIINFLSFQHFADAWDLEMKKDGISVYTRSVSGLKVKSFKGVTQVNSSISELIAIMKDVNNGVDWIYMCEKAELIDTNSFWEQYNYYVIKVPLFFQNRDMVMHLSMTQDIQTKVVTIKIENASERIPLEEELFRVPSLEGFWRFKPITDNIVEVTYQLNVDPGGNIPILFANIRAVKDPFYTLKGLKEMVDKGRYKGSTFNEILD